MDGCNVISTINNVTSVATGFNIEFLHGWLCKKVNILTCTVSQVSPPTPAYVFEVIIILCQLHRHPVSLKLMRTINAANTGKRKVFINASRFATP